MAFYETVSSAAELFYYFISLKIAIYIEKPYLASCNYEEELYMRLHVVTMISLQNTTVT